MKKQYNILTLFVVLILSAGCSKSFLDTRIDTNMKPEDLETNRGTLWSFCLLYTSRCV